MGFMVWDFRVYDVEVRVWGSGAFSFQGRGIGVASSEYAGFFKTLLWVCGAQASCAYCMVYKTVLRCESDLAKVHKGTVVYTPKPVRQQIVKAMSLSLRSFRR